MPHPKFNIARYVFVDDPEEGGNTVDIFVEGDDPHAPPRHSVPYRDARECAQRVAREEGGLDVILWSTCPHCDKHIGRDYYMVRDEVWEAVQVPERSQLHLACLAERLGRKLTIGDFPRFPVNHDIHFGYSLSLS